LWSLRLFLTAALWSWDPLQASESLQTDSRYNTTNTHSIQVKLIGIMYLDQILDTRVIVQESIKYGWVSVILIQTSLCLRNSLGKFLVITAHYAAQPILHQHSPHLYHHIWGQCRVVWHIVYICHIYGGVYISSWKIEKVKISKISNSIKTHVTTMLS
jgi:hypothetical protein